MSLQDSVLKDRIYSRLLELGILTPEETITAIDTGRLPDKESSHRKSKGIHGVKKTRALYSTGGRKPFGTKKNQAPEKPKQVAKQAGRPDGTSGIPQQNRKVSPVGQVSLP